MDKQCAVAHKMTELDEHVTTTLMALAVILVTHKIIQYLPGVIMQFASFGFQWGVCMMVWNGAFKDVPALLWDRTWNTSAFWPTM